MTIRGLRRSDLSRPGFTRVRAGRGFAYRDPAGHPSTDPEVRARIDSLAIPPAWTAVWISPQPNGHIQATGVDAAGRTQYIYHPRWREHRDRDKYARALELAKSLPSARRKVTRALRTDGLTRERVLAAAFRMLDAGSLRVGAERYAQAHGSHGLSTLEGSHVTVSGDRVTMSFPAKSGQEWSSEIDDADLAAVVRQLRRGRAHDRLLSWRDDQGWHVVTAAEINGYVRELTGGEFTAKDFRTLSGTVAAARSLATAGAAPSRVARARAEAQAARDAAAVLGNTPSIARSSYIDPRVIDRYRSGSTIDPKRLHASEAALRALLAD
ncbi:MAG: topoisomerase [Rhodoglobus sp.]|nr:topoisomerase [Rhodoglobus sp.]